MTDSKALADALARVIRKRVGPSIDDDIQHAILRHGKEAVKEAVARLTKPKRGRKPDNDLPKLRDTFEADATELLSGGNPFKSRSNYAIANAFADNEPGHNRTATVNRIERKLRARRVRIALIRAMEISESQYPYAVHLRSIEAIYKNDPNDFWLWFRDRANEKIAAFVSRFGHPPPDEISFSDLKNASLNAFTPKLPSEAGNGIFSLPYLVENNSKY